MFMITKLYGDLIWNKYKDVEAPNLHVYLILLFYPFPILSMNLFRILGMEGNNNGKCK